VDICALDDNDVCMGCRRTADEIGQWWTMSDDQKRQLLSEIKLREAT